MKKEIIYDGGEYRIFATDDPDKVIIHFKDIATAYGGIKRATVKDKGKYCNKITAVLYAALEKAGIPTRFLATEEDEREQLCLRAESIPLHIIVRNRLAGSTAELLGVENGTEITNTVFELRYVSQELSDPMINRHHAVALGIVSYDEVDTILDIASRTNDTLKALFAKAGIELVDFKMECGRTVDGRIIINGGISPDNARLWEIGTGRVLDKDRFRHDLSEVAASYKEVMEKIS